MIEDICKHCKERIVNANYATGQSWVHLSAEAISFEDGAYKFCRKSVAEPVSKVYNETTNTTDVA